MGFPWSAPVWSQVTRESHPRPPYLAPSRNPLSALRQTTTCSRPEPPTWTGRMGEVEDPHTVYTAEGVKNWLIYKPVTQYANCVWTVCDCRALYLQSVNDLCVNYGVWTWYVHRMRVIKGIHRWHMREKSVSQTWNKRSLKDTKLWMHLAKITHICVGFT